MRRSSLFLSLLIHLLFLLALASWSSSLLKEAKKRPAVAEIPLELCCLQPSPVPKKKEARTLKTVPEKKETRAIKKKESTLKTVKKRVKKRVSKPEKKLRKRSVSKSEVHREVKPERSGGEVERKRVEEPGLKEVKKPEKGSGEAGKTSSLREGETGALQSQPEAVEEPQPSQFNPEDYKRLVVAVLERNKFYPPLARRMGIEGTVKVEITFNRAGEPVEIRVLNSPPRVLKRAAVRLIRESSFPPLPSTYAGERLKLKVSIAYRLR